jgi:hypothetical protein
MNKSERICHAEAKVGADGFDKFYVTTDGDAYKELDLNSQQTL